MAALCSSTSSTMPRWRAGKKLRELQDGSFLPHRRHRTPSRRFRVIAASNRRFPTGESGHFREDLFYRCR